jgi:hypothetical protein
MPKSFTVSAGYLQTAADKTVASYMAHVSNIISKYQITNGGPVILWQPENEYTGFSGVPFSPPYMQYVEDQARNGGIVIPLMNNDASPEGHDVPGSGVGEVDIYVRILRLPTCSMVLLILPTTQTDWIYFTGLRQLPFGIQLRCAHGLAGGKFADQLLRDTREAESYDAKFDS